MVMRADGASELPQGGLLAVRREQAATYLSISKATLDRLSKDGEIRYVKLAAIKLYPVKELERWLETKTQRANRHDKNDKEL